MNFIREVHCNLHIFSGYEVLYSTSEDGEYISAGKTADNSLTINGLTLNTTYYVRAYATNAAGTSYGETKTINLLPVDFSSAKSLGRPSNCYIVPSSGIYYFQCSKYSYSFPICKCAY